MNMKIVSISYNHSVEILDLLEKGELSKSSANKQAAYLHLASIAQRLSVIAAWGRERLACRAFEYESLAESCKAPPMQNAA